MGMGETARFGRNEPVIAAVLSEGPGSPEPV